MPDVFGNVQQQLNDFWQGLENSQKVKLISVVAISLMIIIVGVYALSRPNYVELFIGLDTKDMAEVTEKLDEVKISYKISENTRNILVPESEKSNAQMQLARANLPRSNAKYADAYSSDLGFGATESDKKREYNERKAREIEFSLKDNSSAILDAKVLLYVAEDSGFFGEQKKSTASVEITPNGELSPNQVEGIARFVANSVAGLDPKDVEVMDNNMNILKDFDDQYTGGADKQYNLVQTKKKNLEKDIRALLSNNSSEYDDVKVIANLVLDFDTLVEDGKTYDPVIDGSGAIISQNEQKEQLLNGTNGGVPGTDSNDGISTYPTEGSSSGSSYTNSDTTTNYVYNEKIYQTRKALGQIDKGNSSIAVSLYYGNNVENVPDQEVINKVTNLVKMASGIAIDKITVQSSKIVKEANEKSSINYMIYVQEYGIFVISLILVILLGIAVLTGSAGKVKFNNQIDNIVLSKPDRRHLEEIQLEESSEVIRQIDKFIQQKPDAVAQLLRNWLTEDWE